MAHARRAAPCLVASLLLLLGPEVASPFHLPTARLAARFAFTSYDDPDAVVIAVSDDGPVTVMRHGLVVGRSPDDDAVHA